MKVTIIIPSLGGGGAEKNAVTLANSWSTDHDVSVLTAYDVISKENKKLLKPTVEYIPLGKKSVLRSLYQTFSYITKTKPDVVFTTVAYQSLLLSIFIPILPKGSRYIYRETNIPSLYNASSPKGGVFNFLYKTTISNFDLVICQSNDMQNDLLNISCLKEKQTVKINNPIINKFEFNRGTVESFVLAAGRLSEQKGFSDLILDYSKSCLPNKNIVLKIAGDGHCYKELNDLIIELGLTDKIELLGFVDDITPLLDRALFFILSSKYEGFPNVLLESLSRGCPALSNNCKGGVNEIVVSGKNGYIYGKDNFNLMSEKMLATNFIYSEISKDILERFSYELILNNYKEVVFQ